MASSAAPPVLPSGPSVSTPILDNIPSAEAAKSSFEDPVLPPITNDFSSAKAAKSSSENPAPAPISSENPAPAPISSENPAPAFPSEKAAKSSSEDPALPAPLAPPVPTLLGSPSHSLKSTWASVLAENESSDCLPPVRVKFSKGVVRAALPIELLKDQAPLWSKYIAGHFIGDVSPHIGKVHATVNRLWTSPDKKARIDAQFISPKVVLFKIEDQLMRRRVLQRQFWHISDIPMIVQEWSPSNAGKSPDLSSLPLWIDFVKVPDSLFSKKGLLFLGNLVGKAQKLHPSTERCTRFDVARVLVEVNLNRDLPSMIKLDGETEISIPIAYPWLPPRCSKCGCWGHRANDCTSMAGDPLVGPVSGSCPQQIPIVDPSMAAVEPELAIASAVPAELSPPSQGNTSLVQVDNLEQGIAAVQRIVLPEPLIVSPAADLPSLPSIPPSTGIDTSDQNWTIVTKSKGSPGRTIMTRGKCVAPIDSLQSRYQLLGKDVADSASVEDGDIAASLKQSSSSSEDENSDDHLTQIASLEARNKAKVSTKKVAARRKDASKVSRQTSKSKKSSSRKA